MVADMYGGAASGARGIRGYALGEDPAVIEADRSYYRETGPRAAPMLTAEGAEADNPYMKALSDLIGGAVNYIQPALDAPQQMRAYGVPVPHWEDIPAVKQYQQLSPRTRGLLGSAGELALSASDPFL